MSNEKNASGLSRRAFLKGTTALATFGAAGAACLTTISNAEAEAPVEESIVGSFCRCNCGSAGCTFNLKVRDGNVVEVMPGILHDAEDDPEKGRTRACLRGLSNHMREYDPNRILYPLRRVEGTKRGDGQWERITWEEALDEVAAKIEEYQSEFGKESVATWSIFGNHALIHGETGFCWTRLAYYLGNSDIVTGADWAGMYVPPFHVGNLFAGPVCNSIPKYTRTYVAWGANPAESYPHEYRYVCDARENGCRLAVVDPRVSASASAADRHYRIRPGSDTALALAIAKYYIDNDLCDVEYMQQNSDAPFLVREDTGLYLRTADLKGAEGSSNSSEQAAYVFEVGKAPELAEGRHDAEYLVWDNAANAAVPANEAQDPAIFGTYEIEGVRCTTVFSLFKERTDEWDLEHASEVTDIAVEDIVELAEMINDGPTVLQTGYGFGHFYNSFSMSSATCALVIMTGNLGKPGAGYGPSPACSFNPSQAYSYPEDAEAVVIAGVGVQHEEGWVNPRGRSISVSQLPDVMATGMYNGEPLELKVVLHHSGNPFGNTPGRTELMEAVEKIDYIVSCELMMTDTSRYADIILPVAFWFEEQDMYQPWQTQYMYYGGKAVEPLGECKSEFEICQLLAERLGFGEYFQDDETKVMREAIDNGGNLDVNGDLITYDRLVDETWIRTLDDEYYDFANGVYSTATARANFYIENAAPRLDWGDPTFDPIKVALPYFEPPHEAWNESVGGYEANPLAKKYPLIFYSMHARWRTHTTYGDVEWLRELDPEPRISINPQDAAARGIAEGDLVRAFNDRGEVVVRARIDAGMRPGSVNVPHGWQEHQFVRGHYANLSSRATHQFDANDNVYDCLCEVELWEDE